MTAADRMQFDYNLIIKNASSAYLDNQYVKAHKLYSDALEWANKLHTPSSFKCILKYMLCKCILESNSYEEFSEAVTILQNIDEPLKDKFPNIYCLLAQFHCKLYRFDKGAEVLKQVKNFSDDKRIDPVYIPGTKVEIENHANKKYLDKLKEECNTWHKPDAICSLSDCCNITKPYTTPNKRIFFSDPAFNGMIKVNCNNINRPCFLNYHQLCWKTVKDQLYPFQKVSDKEVIGNDCLTSDCKNDDNTPCKISLIQVYGPNGQLKSDIKSNSIPWPVNKNESKGAIKKAVNKKEKGLSNKTEVLNAQLKQQDPVTAKKNSIPNKKLEKPLQITGICYNTNYDKNQILVIKPCPPDVDFSSEYMEEVRNEKVFLYSYFLQCVGNNLVRICDLWDEFKKLKLNLRHLRHIDILKFLLGTNAFQVLEKHDDFPGYLSKNQENMLPQENTDCQQSMLSPENTNISEKILPQKNTMPQQENSSLENMPLKESTLLQQTKLPQDSTIFLESTYSKEKIMPTKNVFSQENSSLRNEPLLESNTKLQGNIPHFSKSYQKTSLTSSQGLDNLYDDLMNEDQYDDDVDERISKLTVQDVTEEINNFHEIASLETYSVNLGSDASSGDAQSTYSKQSMNEVQNAFDHNESEYEREKRDAEVRKLKEHIAQLEKDVKESESMAEKLQIELLNKDSELKNLEEERNMLIQKVEKADMTMAEFKKKYDKLQNDNKDLKKELITAIETKNELEEKLLLSDNSDLKKQEVLKTFYEEYRILEDCIRSEEKEKTQLLENSLESELTAKAELIAEMIDVQYSKNMSLLNEHLKQCKLILNIVEKVGEWFKQTLNINYSQDCGQCLKRLQDIQEAIIECQREYEKIKADFESSNTIDWSKFAARFAAVPEAPEENMSKIVLDALNSYKNHCILSHTPPVEKLRTPPGIQSFSMPPQFYAQYSQHYQYVNPAANFMNASPPGLSLMNTVGSNRTMYSLPPHSNMHQIQLAPTLPQQHNPVLHSASKELPNVNSNLCIDQGLHKNSKNSEDNEDGMEQARERLKKYMDGVTSSLSSKDNSNTSNETIKKTIPTSISRGIDSLQSSSTPDKTIVTPSNENKPAVKTAGIETLIRLLHLKYPGSLDTDITEIIYEIRKKHNNSLEGLTLKQILEESKNHYSDSQRIHMLHYFTDGNKSANSESLNTGSDSKNTKEIIPVSSAWKKLDITENNVSFTEGKMECSICVGVITSKSCHLLSCKHSFHKKCIQKWFLTEQTCPNCRIPMKKIDEFPPLLVQN